MNYVITAENTSESWVLGKVKVSRAFVYEDKNLANNFWKDLKTNYNFQDIRTGKAEKVKKTTVLLFQNKQGENPFFATTGEYYEIHRLLNQLGRKHTVDSFETVLPDIEFKKMEFDQIKELNPEDYVSSWSHDDNFDYHQIEVVREATFGQLFYRTTKFVRYDEMLTGREDVVEIRLHPYCSDFNLVKDIELEFEDYDA